MRSRPGPAFVAGALKSNRKRYGIKHIRGAPYHPMTQGKSERFHLSMKNVVQLDKTYLPGQPEEAIAGFTTTYIEAR